VKDAMPHFKNRGDVLQLIRNGQAGYTGHLFADRPSAPVEEWERPPSYPTSANIRFTDVGTRLVIIFRDHLPRYHRPPKAALIPYYS
jgi:hypothetical protein